MKKIKGFTLMELVITIAIIIILSSISAPIYKEYTKKAKIAEGYMLLRTIRSAQVQYYNQYRCFLNGAQSSIKSYAHSFNEDVLGIDSRGNKYFTDFVIGNAGTTWFQVYVFSKEAGYLELTFDRTSGATFNKFN